MTANAQAADYALGVQATTTAQTMGMAATQSAADAARTQTALMLSQTAAAAAQMATATQGAASVVFTVPMPPGQPASLPLLIALARHVMGMFDGGVWPDRWYLTTGLVRRDETIPARPDKRMRIDLPTLAEAFPVTRSELVWRDAPLALWSFCDEPGVAVAFVVPAGIHDAPAAGGLHRRACRHGNVHGLVAVAGSVAKPRPSPAGRPAQRLPPAPLAGVR